MLIIWRNLDKDIYDLIDENSKSLDELVLKYILEYQNLNNEIYKYKNNIYNFVIYKDEECLNSYLEQKRINITKIDFKECYKLLQKNYSLYEENIIIILIDIYLLNQSPFTYFDFYHPNIGIRLDSKNICSSLKVSKAIDILSLEMDNIEGKKVLLSQGINIFNSSSPFYDDICFQFESPNGKDVPLKERLLLYYPHITICDDGCENKGIDLEKYEAICECTFSSILNNNLINNAITGEMFDILQ